MRREGKRCNNSTFSVERATNLPLFFGYAPPEGAEGGDFSAKEVAQSSYNKQQNKAHVRPISRMPLKIGHAHRSKDALLPAQNRAPPAEGWAEHVENKGTFAQKWSTFSQNTAAFWP